MPMDERRGNRWSLEVSKPPALLPYCNAPKALPGLRIASGSRQMCWVRSELNMRYPDCTWVATRFDSILKAFRRLSAGMRVQVSTQSTERDEGQAPGRMPLASAESVGI